jgi:DNA-binding SARP family transcriptional activator
VGERRRRAADVLGAVVAALLACTAVPAVLLLVVGNPLSGGLGHSWQPAPRDALCALALAAWVAWAACASQLIRAVIVHVRRGEVRPLRVGVVSPLDRVAARIAVGVLALSSAGAPLVVATGAGAGAATPTVVVTAAPLGPPETSAVASVSTAVPSVAPSSAPVVHDVRPGESLWQIAEVRLGDGADWMQIAALNLGRDVGAGRRFVDPDHVEAGWRLRLPAEARHHHADRTSAGDHAPSAPRHGNPDRLPELIALGGGSIACAALARRSRRRHRRAPFTGDLDLPLTRSPVSEAAVDADTLLQRFRGVPALHAFEAANCLLARALEDRTAPPRVRTVCVSPSGVTFAFCGAQADAPDGFVALDGGSSWRVGHETLAGLEPSFPYAPLVVPIGDDEEGTWLVVLEPGDVLPVLGESAPSLVRAAGVAAESWAWSDLVAVIEDPGDPRLVTARRRAVPILFVGDPGSLASEVARHAAVLTTAPVAASDLTVLVDRQAATLHPLGRVLHPHLQSADTGQLIAELVGPPTDPDGVPAVESSRRASSGSDAVVPGLVDVRLLTVTPRLDGLAEDLPPNRARRAIELVAYLALHQPDVITSDRLRTRVLGSSDADAAVKTLQNTAYAARRAMGADEAGQPLFPAGSRNGLYQLSPLVTVDVQRAATLAAEGKAHADPQLAMAHYRAALDLVEGEPLANALSGYTWWEAEGHGARVAAVLVDAACTLAALAAEAQLFELARWGLERARVVEPYSEALSRAAMELAAAEGDADRLRLEWRECQRRVDALDPGSTPSPRTETLYGELSRRVLVSDA